MTQELPGIPAGPKTPAWLMTWRFLRDRKAMVPGIHEKYGDTFSIKILPGPRTFVVFSEIGRAHV